MALSAAEQYMLRAQYDSLSSLTRFPNRFANQKQRLIDYCIENDIVLYNLAHMKLATGKSLLDRIIAIVTGRSSELLSVWQQAFAAAEREADLLTRQTHASAYLSVADQYSKQGFVQAETLLSMQDMETLLADPNFQSDDVLSMAPFSLTQLTQSQTNTLQQLLETAESDPDQIIFLPVHHEGHWFYLVKYEGQWQVRDSQALLAGNELSPRQQSMMRATQGLLAGFGVLDPIDFHSSGKQLNDYDCGTQVLNAWRFITGPEGYQDMTHAEVLIEARTKQQPQKELVLPIIEETVEFSSSEEDTMDFEGPTEVEQAPPTAEVAVANYTQSLLANKHGLFGGIQNKIEETVEFSSSEEDTMDFEGPTEVEQAPPTAEVAVANYTQSLLANKHGLFGGIQNKIDVTRIDQAKAMRGESDEEFAIRLQEAEFRKAGLI